MIFSECFSYFGVPLRCPRGVWSGVSADGEIVVVALWDDALRIENEIIHYDDTERLTGPASGGAILRLEHLNHALETGAIVKIVRIIAENTTARPRSVARACPETRHRLRITEIDQYTGAFRGECVPVDWALDEPRKTRILETA